MPTVIRFNKKRYLASGVNLNELFDQIPEPIAYFDADNRLGACNLSFRDNFPIMVESDFLQRASSGPVSGQSTISYDSLSRLARHELTDARANLGSPPAALPATVSTRPGDFEPELRKTADGGTLLTFRDLAPLRKMEEQYQQQIDMLKAELAAAHRARQEAVDTARARKDFLTSTSHELRTPLNAILGFSEMVAKEMFGPLNNPRYLEYAQIIHNSGVHVLSLINDLLDLSKLDAGKLGEPRRRHVLLRADAGGGVAHAGLLLGEIDQLGELVNAELRVGGKHDRLLGKLDHRHEVFQRIEAHLENVWRARHLVRRNQHRVAVGRALGGEVKADVAAAARFVLDHDLLAEHA